MSFKYHPNHLTSLGMHNLIDCDVLINGKYQPARPISCPTMFERIKLAWWVFIGKADVITWPYQ